MADRRSLPRWLRWSFALIVVLWIVTAIVDAVDGNYGSALLYGLAAVVGASVLVMQPRRGTRRVPISDSPLRRSRGARGLWIGVAFVFYVVGFGVAVTLLDGEHLTVERIVSRGLLFGVLMTLFDLWLRRRGD